MTVSNAGRLILVHQIDHVDARPRTPIQPDVLAHREQAPAPTRSRCRSHTQERCRIQRLRVLPSHLPQPLPNFLVHRKIPSMPSMAKRSPGVKKTRMPPRPCRRPHARISAKQQLVDLSPAALCVVRQRDPKLVIPARLAIATMPPSRSTRPVSYNVSQCAPESKLTWNCIEP